MKKHSVIILIIFLTFSLNGFSSDLDKYLIPTPKSLELLTLESDVQVCLAKNDNLQHLITALCSNENTGEVKLLSMIYGINSIKISIESKRLKPQAYMIKIEENSISIVGHDFAALYYAKKTLLQILEYSIYENKTLPCLLLKDSPDFERRGFMLDVSRDKVPTMETLYNLIDLLADLKTNELQLYIEHSFAYKNHAIVWENASPLTPDEIKQLDEYCKSKYIDLVPNQNSFGHMENWLKHDEYLDLAECPNSCNTIWGPSKRHSLDPTNPKSLELMQELYAELLPNFTSKYFNVGCDETVELGHGKSKSVCDSEGKGKVYLDYLIKLNTEANKYDKQTQFWGDIILNHPELISDLPKNMIALVWGYGENFPYNKRLPKFKNAGLDFYVCPGTSTWNSLIGRNENAFGNLKNAAENGKKYGAKGFLNTSWGDNGHWQPLSVTYPSILVGAAYAWNANNANTNNIEFQLNHYVFKDETGNTAKAIIKLGNAYLKTNIPNGNANAFHLMLYRYKWTLDGFYQTKELNIEGLQNAEIEINEALEILTEAKPQSADSVIIIAEINQAANLAIHSIHLGIARIYAKDNATENIPLEIKADLRIELTALIAKHRELWIIRNRIGGLDDSAGKLENLLEYYR